MENSVDQQPSSTDEVFSQLCLQVNTDVKQLKDMYSDLKKERDELKCRVTELELQNQQLIQNSHELVRIIGELQERIDSSNNGIKPIEQKYSVIRLVDGKCQTLVTADTNVDFDTTAGSGSPCSISHDVFLDSETNSGCINQTALSTQLPLVNTAQDQSTEKNTSVSEDGSMGLEGERNEKTPAKESNETKSHRNPSVLSCVECKEIFTNTNDLHMHCRTHNSEKPYLCVECGHRFTILGSLRRHMVAHSGEKSYQCDQCGLQFTRLHNMKRHQVLHSTERIFKCDYCARKFKSSSQLEKHLLTHANVKKYQCAVCGRGFSSAVSLKTHMRAHSGEKPYQCKLCNELFSQMVGLRKHMEKHEQQEKNYQQCEQTVESDENLPNHVQTH